MSNTNTSLLDQVNTMYPIDETRDDYALIMALRKTMFIPPEYKPRPEVDYETCERIMLRGMYAGQKCNRKREKQRDNGKWYCESCSKLKLGFINGELD